MGQSTATNRREFYNEMCSGRKGKEAPTWRDHFAPEAEFCGEHFTPEAEFCSSQCRAAREFCCASGSKEGSSSSSRWWPAPAGEDEADDVPENKTKGRKGAQIQKQESEVWEQDVDECQVLAGSLLERLGGTIKGVELASFTPAQHLVVDAMLESMAIEAVASTLHGCPYEQAVLERVAKMVVKEQRLIAKVLDKLKADVILGEVPSEDLVRERMKQIVRELHIEEIATKKVEKEADKVRRQIEQEQRYCSGATHPSAATAPAVTRSKAA